MVRAPDWDRYAQQYDVITMGGANHAYTDLVSRVSAHFLGNGIHRHSLVCDLGGGTGNFSIPLAEHFPESTFVIMDTSKIMLNIAQIKASNLGLKNVHTEYADMEDIESIVNKYSRPINHSIMMHSLYATGNFHDDKPRRILKNLRMNMEKGGWFYISDINRKLNTQDWIPYCLGNVYSHFRRSAGPIISAYKTLMLFLRNDQAKAANKYIDDMQKAGNYMLCSLPEFKQMLEESGFSDIIYINDKLYRGRDNTAIVRT